MTELLQHATHDQIALTFCFGALVISAAIMHFSVHIGQLTGKTRAQDRSHEDELQLQRVQLTAQAEYRQHDKAA